MQKISPNAARVLSLVPHVIEENEVLNMVVDSDANGAVHGFEAIEINGGKFHIFLEMVANYGDCPSSASFSDVKGHTENAMCPSCSFQRRRG